MCKLDLSTLDSTHPHNPKFDLPHEVERSIASHHLARWSTREMCKPNLEPNPPLEVKSPIDSRHLIRWSTWEMCEPDLESNPPHEVKHPIASRHLERWSTREMCVLQDGSPYRYDNLAR
ncbi:hypothetical protein PVK06_040848 [Gossypium arboreum]|uniref:Uncharacterized protein n=1 Tax=Gossypium arboreum TaxID=29729 RepID=A0ABR0N6V5_GOSAR|nr:hypothetical protein PVK06_040848 [Gossypium arboreum]